MSKDSTETLTGSQVVVRLLERQGIRRIPGIPGGAILPFYDALSQSTLIEHVLARHEQGAGFMAQGAARATGDVAVCLATSGPGATNLLTAMQAGQADFTLAFRRLADLVPTDADAAPFPALFQTTAGIDTWLPAWRARIADGNRTLDFPDFTQGQWQARKRSFALDDRY